MPKSETSTMEREASHPRTAGPKPPFTEQKQETPGSEQKMTMQPDHGENSYRGLGKLKGKRALITGADSGIGRAVALAFAREGADITISFLSETEDAIATARAVTDAGRKALSIKGDITNEAHCQELIQRTVDELGGIDILVNNAAHQMEINDLDKLSTEEWDKTFRTNIYAMFFLSKAALPHMKEGSCIINTASVQAYKPSPALLAYASTKGAIVTFSKAFSQLAIERGVRVNAVAPGPVWTPLIPSTLEEQHVKEFGKSTLMQRPAQPAELAPAFVFLASNDSQYVTGSVLDLTGGSMLP